MSVVDEIKARLDVVDVVSGYIPLKKAGRNYKALCPFHSEKTPSFVVNPDRQSWRCFGSCGEGGDIFSFVMKIEGFDFPEALRVLAERAGVELREYTPQQKEKEETQARLKRIVDETAELYHTRLLKASDAASVRDYVFHKRGLNAETVEAFTLGYAPDAWDFALNHFQAQGYHIDELLAAGIVNRNDAGRIYDRFRHRLMIPIRDARGQTLGFGARALSDDQNPKYLNSSQGPLFDKSQLLYGLDLARRAIRETETVVVVEGYMDVISVYQAGYHNVVAQMGTALTDTQVRQLARYANRLILALDTDAAGQQATMRGLEVVRESLSEDTTQTGHTLDVQYMMHAAGRLSMDVRVLRLPAGKDPDDFVRHSPAAWPDVVDAAQPLIDYVIEVGTQDLSPNPTIQEREQVARRLLPMLTSTESDLSRRYNLQQLATYLRIPEAELLGWAIALEQETQQQHKRKIVSKPNTQPTKIEIVGSSQGDATERYCLSGLLLHPNWLFSVNRKFRELSNKDAVAMPLLQRLDRQDFSQEAYRLIYDFIEDTCYQGENNTLERIQTDASSEVYEIAYSIASFGRLEAFRETTSELNWTEAESIVREQQYFVDENEEQRAFLIQALTLRLKRIKDERQERYFFTSADQQHDVMTEDDEFWVLRYMRAQLILEQAIRDLTRSQSH